MIVTFKTHNGRFANNVFQYIASKIVAKLTGKTYQYGVNPGEGGRWIYINDFSFYGLLQGIEKGSIDVEVSIYLDGYFQFDDLIHRYDEWIRSLLDPSNVDVVNDEWTMGQIATYLQEYKENPKEKITDEDLVLHLRLDDFGICKTIIDPRDTTRLIERLLPSYKRLVIVVDQIRHEFENTYLLFFTKFNPVYVTGTMIEDFACLYHAKNVVLSNSTFSWLAMILGPKRCHWIPQNLGIFSNQKFDKINEYTKIYPANRILVEDVQQVYDQEQTNTM